MGGVQVNVYCNVAVRVTSPRLRGEVGVRAKRGLRVRGRFHRSGASGLKITRAECG